MQTGLLNMESDSVSMAIHTFLRIRRILRRRLRDAVHYLSISPFRALKTYISNKKHLMFIIMMPQPESSPT